MDTFQAIADPTRRRIIEMLSVKGELSATDISKKFRVSSPAISQHLKVLKETKIVDVERKAQKRIYTINPKKIDEVEAWTKKLKKNWEVRFERLDKILLDEKK